MLNQTLTWICLSASIATSLTAEVPAMQSSQKHNEERPSAHCSVQAVKAELIAWASPANDPTGQSAKQSVDNNRREEIVLTTELRLNNTSAKSQDVDLISLDWSEQGTNPKRLNWSPGIDMSPLNQFTDNTHHLISARPKSEIRVSTTLRINNQTCRLHTSLEVLSTP